MKVSVLVPVYGVERYIDRCARSLFSQTWQDIEYIFVDDLTRDRSIEVLRETLREFPRREGQVRIITHEINRGLAAARNTALSYATGEYVLHVDSDDYIETDAVELLVKKAEAEDADMVVFDMNTVYTDRVVPRTDYIGENKEEYICRLLLRKVVLGVWGKFFRRTLFSGHGVSFVEGLNYGEDYVMSPRLAYYARRIVKLDRPLYNYVQFNDGAYTKNINERSVENILQAVEILYDFFSQIPDAHLYAGCVEMMRLRNKIDMLKVTGTELRQKIAGLYPETRSLEKHVPLADRIVLRLARRGCWMALDRYVRYGYRLKRMVGLK